MAGLKVSPNLSAGFSASVPPRVPMEGMGNGGTKTPEDITCSMSRRLVPSRMEGACGCCPKCSAPSPYKTLPGPD